MPGCFKIAQNFHFALFVLVMIKKFFEFGIYIVYTVKPSVSCIPELSR